MDTWAESCQRKKDLADSVKNSRAFRDAALEKQQKLYDQIQKQRERKQQPRHTEESHTEEERHANQMKKVIIGDKHINVTVRIGETNYYFRPVKVVNEANESSRLAHTQEKEMKG